MNLKRYLQLIFVGNLFLMGDRKGGKSGAISPFIPESWLCQDEGSNQEAIHAKRELLS